MAKDVVIGRVSVKVMPDLKEFAKETLSDLKKIEKRLPAIEIDAKLNKASVAKVKTELEELTEEKDVSISPTLDKSSTSRTKAALKAAFPSPHRVKIKPSLDKGAAAKTAAALSGLMAQVSGAAFIKNLAKPINDMVRNLGTSTVPMFAALVMALNTLAGVALAGGANLAVLAQDLARIGPVLLPLPGIVASFAIGLGATVAVFKDFNDVLPWVGDELGRIQNLMSDKFWSAAKAPIEDMIRNLLPGFEKGLVNTSGALATFFGNLATSLSSKLGDGSMEWMFDRLVGSIKIAAKFTDSYANVIRNLGIIGAKYLEPLAWWFGEVSRRFGNWLGKSIDNGNMWRWIDRGLENLKSLGSALWSTVGIFDAIADAARTAGGSTMQDLARGLANIEETVNKPSFQFGLVNAFKGASQMMSEIADIAGPAMTQAIKNFATTADELLPSIGRSVGHLADTFLSAFNSPEFQAGFANFVGGLEMGMEALAGSSDSLGAVLGGLKTVMGAIAATAGPLLAAALDALALVVTPLANTVAGIFAFGFTSLTNTIQMITPLIPPVVDAFNNLLLKLQPLAEAVMPVFQAILVKVMEVLPGIIDAFSNLVTKATGLWEVVGPILIPVLQFLIELLAGAVRGLLNGFSNMLGGITTIITNVIDLVKNVFAGEWTAAWENIKNILSGVLQLIWGAIQVWWNGSILAFFKGGILSLAKMWKGGWTGLLNTAKSKLSNIGGAIKSEWSKFTGSFKDGGAKIASHSLAAWNRVRSHFTSAMTSLRSKVQSWVTNFGTQFQKMKTTASNKAQQLWTDVKSKFTSGVNNVVNKIKELPRKIKGAMGNAGSILSGAGKAVIDGFVNALQAGFERVKRKLGNLTSLLPDWKGPRDKDRVLLKDAGQLIIQSLIDGFESRFGDVRKSLGSLTDEIGGMEVDGPTVTAASASARKRVMSAMVSTEGAGSSTNRTINYYAADGRSLPEEDLFEALNRGRAWGF